MGSAVNSTRGAVYQAPIQDSGDIEQTVKTDAKTETEPLIKDRTNLANPSGRKLEQTFNGTARKAELHGQLGNKGNVSDSMSAARKILENPKLSNEAKISELGKMIGNTDKTEFVKFMAKLPNFPTAQKELIHSAISESPKIMNRVAAELESEQQLTVIMNATKYPYHRKSEKEEAESLKRFDKAVGEWIERTDVDTLNKALDGTVDIEMSGKLFGVMMSNPSVYIMHFGYDQARLVGDNLRIGMDLIQADLNRGVNHSRETLEKTAISLIWGYRESSRTHNIR
jgi:hypothetical protein